jgi:hypothetical protein
MIRKTARKIEGLTRKTEISYNRSCSKTSVFGTASAEKRQNSVLVSRKILGNFIEKSISTHGFNNIAEYPQML